MTRITARPGQFISWDEVRQFVVVFKFERLEDVPYRSYLLCRAPNPHYVRTGENSVMRAVISDREVIEPHPSLTTKWDLEEPPKQVIFVGSAILGGLTIER